MLLTIKFSFVVLLAKLGICWDFFFILYSFVGHLNQQYISSWSTITAKDILQQVVVHLNGSMGQHDVYCLLKGPANFEDSNLSSLFPIARIALRRQQVKQEIKSILLNSLNYK